MPEQIDDSTDRAVPKLQRSIPVVETLSDDELAELNRLLPWNAFALDSRGRPFGKATSATKRNDPTMIPDRRIVLLNQRLDLRNDVVLEIGCFEGLHTVPLCWFAKHVKACDSRVSNFAKTAVRCAVFQVRPTLFVWNVEQPPPQGQDVSCDVLHHVGVLYHLVDPVRHLKMIAPLVRRAIFLDTHYARREEADNSFEVDGERYGYRTWREGGAQDPFSGMFPTSRWLVLDELIGLLKRLGFPNIEVVRDSVGRNGPRVSILAER